MVTINLDSISAEHFRAASDHLLQELNGLRQKATPADLPQACIQFLTLEKLMIETALLMAASTALKSCG